MPGGPLAILPLPGNRDAFPTVDPYRLERVDVIKGPASVLYGQSGPGGIVNLVSKVPQFVRHNEIFVQGGGCSGFQYGFTFDEITNDDDTTMTKNGVSLLIDAMSYQYLIGAEIDYKEDLQGAQFVIKNPNASTTCGCGSSFSV